MAEYKSKLQSNLNWGETFKMSRKAPAVANRIFKTKEDAQAYVDDLNDSATEGIRVSVIGDSDSNNNGLYYVKTIGNGTDPGELVQVGRGSAAWYKGNAVSGDESTRKIVGATPGDCYMNTQTLDIYVLGDDGIWAKQGNMTALKIDKTVPYYKLSVDGTSHPDWDIEEWTAGNEDGTNIPSNYEDFEAGQVYLWTRFYDKEGEEYVAKYTVALVYSSLNLGSFEIK